MMKKIIASHNEGIIQNGIMQTMRLPRNDSFLLRDKAAVFRDPQ